MPVDLAPELRPYWDEIEAKLPAGVVKDHDVFLIVQLCQAMHAQALAWKNVVADGIETVDMAHGGEKRRNPAIITWRQAADMARQCMNMLGLSPISRARIQSADDGQRDQFLDYLRRRHGQTEAD